MSRTGPLALALRGLAACRADGPLDAELTPSEHVPSAARVSWTGPAGIATLEVAAAPLGAWRTAATAPVEEGRSSLPLALLPVGKRWRWRVVVEDGEERWRSRADIVRLDAPDLVELGPKRQRPGNAMSDGLWVGYQYGVKNAPEEAIALVLDGDGEIVWWAAPSREGHRVIRVRPSEDLRSILILEDHEDPALRRIVRLAVDGSERIETATPDASHDFWEGDESFTYVAYHLADTSLPRTPPPTAADRLRTVPEGSIDGADAADGFDFFDDYPVEPWRPCYHARWDDFVPEAAEWTHTNSLIRSPRDDGWLLAVRHLDAIVAVDDDGQFAWQAGGRDATLEATGPAAAFEHGHSSHAWTEPDGMHLLVFDNGDHSPEPIVSRVVELKIAPEAGTVSAVWQLPDPEGESTSFLGDARRLPNGDTLVAWTERGLAEYTPEGEEVWSLELEGFLGRGFWVPRLDLLGP